MKLKATIFFFTGAAAIVLIACVLLLSSKEHDENNSSSLAVEAKRPKPAQLASGENALSARIAVGHAPAIQSEDLLPGDAINKALTQGKNMHFVERRHILWNRQSPLSSAEFDAVNYFLLAGQPAEMTQVQYYAFVNDILNLLGKQASCPEQTKAALETLLEDDDIDAVVRDYLLQHMLDWDFMDAGHKKSLALAAAAQVKQPYSGTAMLALYRFARDGQLSTAERESALNLILSAAMDANAHEAARISAIQTASLLDADESWQYAQLILENEQSILLRIAALNALSRSKDPAALNLIANYTTSSNPRLRLAAKSALSQ